MQKSLFSIKIFHFLNIHPDYFPFLNKEETKKDVQELNLTNFSNPDLFITYKDEESKQTTHFPTFLYVQSVPSFIKKIFKKQNIELRATLDITKNSEPYFSSLRENFLNPTSSSTLPTNIKAEYRTKGFITTFALSCKRWNDYKTALLDLDPLLAVFKAEKTKIEELKALIKQIDDQTAIIQNELANCKTETIKFSKTSVQIYEELIENLNSIVYLYMDAMFKMIAEYVSKPVFTNSSLFICQKSLQNFANITKTALKEEDYNTFINHHLGYKAIRDGAVQTMAMCLNNGSLYNFRLITPKLAKNDLINDDLSDFKQCLNKFDYKHFTHAINKLKRSNNYLFKQNIEFRTRQYELQKKDYNRNYTAYYDAINPLSGYADWRWYGNEDTQIEHFLFSNYEDFANLTIEDDSSAYRDWMALNYSRPNFKEDCPLFIAEVGKQEQYIAVNDKQSFAEALNVCNNYIRLHKLNILMYFAYLKEEIYSINDSANKWNCNEYKLEKQLINTYGKLGSNENKNSFRR